MSGATPRADLPLHSAGVVLADPPWWFTTYSERGWKKSAHHHYPCMSLDAIAALPIADLCAPDCVLVLWHTQTHLPHALHVMDQWGFAKPSQGAWAKQSKTGTKWAFGTGYLMRSAAEFWLVATCGHPQQLSRSFRNLIVAPVREHSRKPDEMYEQIEATWPGPYVELFARYPRFGWSQWPDPTVQAEARPPARALANHQHQQRGDVAS